MILGKIKSSIGTHGYHVTVVQGGPSPRFAHTIGLHATVGFELVFAGGAFFSFDEILYVVKHLARRIIAAGKLDSPSLEVDGLGSTSIHEAEASWANRLLLGALDYYGLTQIRAFQIAPDEEHWTIDIPDMSESWSPGRQPVWKWLEGKWQFPVRSVSRGITNLEALRGMPITEVTRWEEDEWELFAGAGPDVDKDDLRNVPLATMLGYDSTLECVCNLEIGSGCWRDDRDHDWNAWTSRGGNK